MVNQKVVNIQEKTAKKALGVMAFIDFVVLYPLAAKFLYFTPTGIYSVLVGLLAGILGTVLLITGIFPYFPSKYQQTALVQDVIKIDKFVGAHATQIETDVAAEKGAIDSAATAVATKQ